MGREVPVNNGDVSLVIRLPTPHVTIVVLGTNFRFQGARHNRKAKLRGPGGDLLQNIHATTIELLQTNLEDPALYRIMIELTPDDTITFFTT